MANNDIYLVREAADGTFEEIANSPFRYDASSNTDLPDKANNTFHINTKLRVDELEVNGDTTVIHTDTNTTEQLSVTNDGTGPAAIINQIGAEPLIDIQDDGVSAFYIEDGGNVGIGTTNPSGNLDVVSDSSSGTNLYIQNTSDPAANCNWRLQADSNGDFNIGVVTTSFYKRLQFTPQGAVSIPNGILNIGDVDSGSVGIGLGANTPARKLEIYGDRNAFIRLTNQRTSEGVDQILGGLEFASKDTSGDPDNPGAGVRSSIKATSEFADGTGGNLIFSTATATSNEVECMRIAANGNVGIGTSSPNGKLHLNLEISDINTASGLLIDAQSGGTNSATLDISVRNTTDGNEFASLDVYNSAQAHASPKNLILQPSGGNVGIGTTTPESYAKLHVVNDGPPAVFQRDEDMTSGWGTHLALRNDSLVDGIAVGLDFQGLNTDGVLRTAGRISTKILSHADDNNQLTSKMCFGLGSSQELMVLDQNGKLTFGGIANSNLSTIGTNDSALRLHPDTGRSIQFYTNDTSRVYIHSDGNVGIGTDSPEFPLHIKNTLTNGTVMLENDDADSSAAPDLILRRSSSSPADSDNLGHIKWQGKKIGNDGVHSTVDYADIYGKIEVAGEAGSGTSGGAGQLRFRTRTGDGSGAHNEMCFDHDGRLGIGALSPNHNLEVRSSGGAASNMIWAKLDNLPGDAVMEGAWTTYGVKVYDEAAGQPDYSWSVGMDSSETGTPKFKIGYSFHDANKPGENSLFTIESNGDIHFTGDLYQNGTLFTGGGGGGGGSTGAGGTSFGGGTASTNYPNPLDVSGDTSSGTNFTISNTYNDGTPQGTGNTYRFCNDPNGGALKIGPDGGAGTSVNDTAMLWLMPSSSHGGVTSGAVARSKLSVRNSYLEVLGDTENTPGGSSYNQDGTELKVLTSIGHKSTYYGVVEFDYKDLNADDTLPIYYFHLVFRRSGAGTMNGFKYKAEIGSSRFSTANNSTHWVNTGFVTDESFAYIEDDLDFYNNNQHMGTVASVGKIETVSREVYPTRDDSGDLWGMKALPGDSDLTLDDQTNYIVRYGMRFSDNFLHTVTTPNAEKEARLHIQLEVMQAGAYGSGVLAPHFINVP